MSHVTSLGTVVTDLAALEEACKALGLTFKRGQTSYRWYGRWVNDYHAEDAAYHHGVKPSDYGRCEHAIACPIKDAYEVGVVKNPNGDGWVLIYDFFAEGLGLENYIGPKAQMLRQAYSTVLTTKHLKKLRKKGFKNPEIVVHPNGTKEIVAVRSR